MNKQFRLAALIVVMAGAFAAAQQATIVTPVADSNYKVVDYIISRAKVVVNLRVNDAVDNTKTYATIIDNDTAAFLQALDQAIPNETGGVIRKREARVLQRLLDAGLLPGVTIVP